MNTGESDSFERAGAVGSFLRGGFDLHDGKRRASSPAPGSEYVLRSGTDIPAHRAKSSKGARGGGCFLINL
jgi:hypothetical protein